MKKFVIIFATIMALVSCEKAPTVEPNNEENEIESLVFDNTITHGDKSYPITSIEIVIEEEADELGYGEPVFYITAEAEELLSTSGTYTMEYLEFNKFESTAIIPVSNYGKIYNLKDTDTYGGIAFAMAHVVEAIFAGSSTATNSDGADGVCYLRSITDEDSYIFVKGEEQVSPRPKVAKYYIDIERTYKEFYKVYLEFEDADGNKYKLSYKGDKELS